VIVYFAVAWAAGLALADLLKQSHWVWLLLAALALGSLALLRDRRRLRLPLACAILLGLGGARQELSRAPLGAPDFLSTYNDAGRVDIEGVVWGEPTYDETRASLRVNVQSLKLSGASSPIPVHGLALVSTDRYSMSRLQLTESAELQYGDRLTISGELRTPSSFDGSSYQAYLARQHVFSEVQASGVTFLEAGRGPAVLQALFAFKRRALSVLERLFPQPHAALLAGILLGAESGIPDDLRDAFNATGTAHIIAISGFNVAILAGLMSAATLRWLGRWRGATVTVAGLAAYSLLVGASGSVVRAAIMGSLALVARQIGRRAQGINVLAATLMAMTLYDPSWLEDVGFQLSALATLGLVLYAAPLAERIQRVIARVATPRAARQAAALAGELVLATGAAQLTTFPLMLHYFQRLSLVSLLANLLILPAQPAVMVSSGLALALGLVWLPLGRLAAWLAWPFTHYTITLVEALARLPGSSFYLGDVGPAVALVLYALLFGVTWLVARPAQQRPAWLTGAARQHLPTGGLMLVALGAVLTWSWYFSLPDHSERLRVSVFETTVPGQPPAGGEGILIQPPGGGSVLIDGGPGGNTLARQLSERLPLFTTRLDVLVLASANEASVGALPVVLERYRVKRAVVTNAAHRSAPFKMALAILRQQGAEIVDAATLPELDLGSGIVLKVVADGPAGSTLCLEWQRFSLLLPIGLDAAGEAELLGRGLARPATALLLANGGAAANTPEWLRALNPQVVLISAGADAPAPEVLARLDGRNLLRTDEHGTVTLETDGQRLWAEVQR
jgi:competence protein ComEC